MSKLEELVTPTELLAAVKEGALKQELVKKFKASEQELAMMLLPLYRRGELTKEEFNDFFKGVSSKKTETEGDAATAGTQNEVEPPSEILQSLSRIFGKKPKESKPQPDEEAATVDLEPERQEIDAADAEPAPSPASEAPHPPSAVAAPAAAPDPASVEEMPDFGEPIATVPEGEPEPPPAVEMQGEEAEQSSGGMDSAGFLSLLNSIFAKLNSIDRRLAEIEKNVSGR